MKKTIFISFLLTTIVFFACQKTQDIKNSNATSNKQTALQFENQGFIQQDEYNNLTPIEKEVANLMNSSIAALKGMELNDLKAGISFEASFQTHSPFQPAWDKGIILAQQDVKAALSSRNMAGECHVDSWSSAASCVRAIVKVADKEGCVNVNVTKSDKGGYDVKYSSC